MRKSGNFVMKGRIASVVSVLSHKRRQKFPILELITHIKKKSIQNLISIQKELIGKL